MSRYSIVNEYPKHDRPGWDEWEDNNAPMLKSFTVDGPYHVDTSLLDQYGNPIYRLANPIGFGRDDEW